MMNQVVQRSGTYVRFDTTQQYHMISLDDQDFFVWRGPNRLELSDMGHEAAEILHQGNYFLFDALTTAESDEPVTHLACQEGIKYRIYILPQGLPTAGNRIVDIIETAQMMSRSTLAI